MKKFKARHDEFELELSCSGDLLSKPSKRTDSKITFVVHAENSDVHIDNINLYYKGVKLGSPDQFRTLQKGDDLSIDYESGLIRFV